MNRVLEVDVDARAWPGSSPASSTSTSPGSCARTASHFAPDPSSQQSCSIGGNVANNSGGPHCLAYGVTSTHVLAVEVVLPDGDGHRARRPRPRAGRPRPARRVRRRRGHARHRHPDRGAPHARTRRRCARCCSTSLGRTTAPPPSPAIIAAGIVPAAHRDDGRTASRRRSRTSSTPASRPTPPPSCSSRSTACPAGVAADVERVERDRPGPRRPHACGWPPTRPSGRCSGRAARTPSAPSPASSRTTTCTTPSCPARGWSRCCAGSTRSPTATS